jgi:hypothetical protein
MVHDHHGKLSGIAPVPPKVKTLAWKICRNALAMQ